jgi:hypothetical protein
MVGIVNGKHYGQEEFQELEKQPETGKEAGAAAGGGCAPARDEAVEKTREQAAQLMRQLSHAYTAYKDFMGRHPELGLQVTEDEAADPELHGHLRENLERADRAPRCAHIKVDGLRCGSPRMKSAALCYTHQRMAESRLPAPQQAPRLPSMMMEDANSIQVALMEVTRALLGGQITEKTAGKLLYSLQIAASNLKRLTFHETPQQMAVDQPEESADLRKPQPSSYETLDPDLKLRLQEISDEVDRRLRERSRSPQVLTTEDTKHHGGGTSSVGLSADGTI